MFCVEYISSSWMWPLNLFWKIFILNFRFSEKATWGRIHQFWFGHLRLYFFNCSCQYIICGSLVYCWNAIWAWFLFKLLCISILLHSDFCLTILVPARFLFCFNISKIVLAITLECSKQFYHQTTKSLAKNIFFFILSEHMKLSCIFSWNFSLKCSMESFNVV